MSERSTWVPPLRLVELADEFHLTTAEAMDLCVAAGIDADGSDATLTEAAADRWRDLARQQRAFRAEATARAEAERRARTPSVIAPSGDSGFGPIPPAPWEVAADDDGGALGGGEASPPVPEVSLRAAAALALAVVSLIFPLVPLLLAVPLAVSAGRQIDRSGGRLTGRRLVTAAYVLCGLGFALWIGLLGWSGWRTFQAQRNLGQYAELQVDAEPIEWNELAVGDCVRIPRADLPVERWQGIDCAAPHEAEVYAVTDLARTTVEPYPGRDSFVPLATETCKAAFAGYVGVPYEQSTLRIAVFFPTARNWKEEADRRIGCIVFQDGYDLINGSLRDAAR